MAAMMRSILAPYIYLDDVPAEQKAFPSPQHFRRRIFIKGSKSETFQLPASEATKHRWLCFEWTIPAAPKRKKEIGNAAANEDLCLAWLGEEKGRKEQKI